LAFEGVESLLHGSGHGSEIGGLGYEGSGVPFAGQPGGETIINNYYDNPNDQSSGNREDQAGYDNRVDGPDMQPQGPLDTSAGTDDAQLEDTSYDSDSDLGSDYDDQPIDDSGFDGGDDSSLV
jgi:hypothetical protein